ncbi:polyketide-type polyunsaturated fatty acid synthase PfaA [Paenibacillus cellulosilyticus]|uniref:Polyketide-type polyunsaturated fatty acid synthase PfaA n=1 Tax=Paenibacillus cellulosilyticus TaxID=375489 RepID=A0A2V2YQR7_9BACL|nr:type I polyketide synthase [Paenibacillus cellulosilyticus]PWV99356.1 polyketide-type polyunsaturated fatty acid synthase PfaA [Paenibacillus cellulosilyticus]QKS45119.1 acyltransferase domain-containing protein [Paenibacillus cellulosilyticus]
MNDSQRSGAIAIVGVSALLPGSTDNKGFWNDIMAGRDLMTDIPTSHWLIEDYYDPTPMTPDKTYSKRGAFLSQVDFDPKEFSMPPSNIPATDTSQLLGLMVAKSVLEDAAQGQFSTIDKDRISVILGTASASELTVELGSRIQRPVWVKALRESGVPEDQVQEISDRIAAEYVPWKESSFPGLLGNVIAGRIANHFNLGGTNCIVDAACASSLTSISMGAMELLSGKSDLVITGGVDTLNDIFMFMCFSQTPALSPTGDCRPFSDQADGTMLGEGLCMFALRRLEDAERDGDRIYAVLRGFGTSSDGKSKSVYAPVSKGQAKALRRAYEMAGYSPATVELMEAHGTGTKAGDAAEFAGLASVFDDGAREDRQWCALGSVKSQIGHTKGTAGAAGMFKAVMALRHKALPPTIKIERPNPNLDIANSPFYLNTAARPWIRGASHPRRASVSAFGFGGSNFHVTLEEYNGPGRQAWKLRSMPSELILLSAKDPATLVAQGEQLLDGLTEDDGLHTYLARHYQSNYDPKLPARLALVTADSNELRSKLEKSIAALRLHPERRIDERAGIYYAFDANPGQVAMLFPGQGSQYLNMGAELLLAFDEARGVWDRAADLEMDESSSLHEVVYPRPVFTQEELDAQRGHLQATEWAQPAIGAMSMSLLHTLRKAGVQAELLAGHSFGELAALCAAGVFDESDMLQAARKRGELMAAASAASAGSGAMSAVFASLEQVRGLMEKCGLAVSCANHNSPSQVVVSGETEAVTRLEERLTTEGIRYKRLLVSTAFHSPLVASSVPEFQSYLAGCSVEEGEAVVLSNADGQPFPSSPDELRNRLAAQIAQPVLFAETVQELYARGVRTFVEVGPSAVLTGLVEQCLAGKDIVAVATDRKGQHSVHTLWHALGRLAAAGVPIDLRAFWDEYKQEEDPRSRVKPAFTIPISGVNSGRPYPPKGGTSALPKPNEARQSSAAPVGASESPILETATPAIQVEQDVSSPVFIHSTTQYDAGVGATFADHSITNQPYAVSNTTVYPINPTQEEYTMSNYSNTPQSVLLGAIMELQRQTVESHAAYQRAMADSHIAYMRTAELALAGLSTLAAGGPGAFAALPEVAAAAAPAPFVYTAPPVAAPQAYMPPAPPVAAAPAYMPPAPPVAAVPTYMPPAPPVAAVPAYMPPAPPVAAAPAYMPPAPPVAATPAYMPPAPVNVPAAPTAAVVQPTAAPAIQPQAPAPVQVQAVPAAAPQTQSSDVRSVMLEVVAEKTGYPVEMLDFDIELEAGLGIDSIKRVEILSAVQDQLPNLPDIQPGELAALNTLGEIVDYMNRALGKGGESAGKK